MNMWRNIGYELLKMAVQKKNFVIAAGHLLFLTLCYIGFRSGGGSREFARTLERAGFSEAFANFIFSCFDGPFLARLVMIPTFLILMPILVATLAGETVAGEMQDGSLKLALSRPRSRTGMILSKFFAIYLMTLFFSLYFAVISLAAAALLRGWSSTQVIFMFGAWGVDFTTMGEPAAILRYGAMVIYFSFSQMALAAIALFFSTIFNRTTAATVAAVTVYFVCYIAALFPFMAHLKDYLLSETMGGATAFLFWLNNIPWYKLSANLALLSIYIVVFLTLAIINFNWKDIR